jgi:VWFA-related protein
MTGAAAALLCAAAGMAAGGQQPRFEARTEVVSLDVVATQDGRAIPGLGVQDFELRDNGVTQVVDHVSAGTTPVDALLVLDTSRSVAGETLGRLKVAASAFLDGLEPRDRVGLVRFNDRLSYVGPGESAVRAALAATTAERATALHDALYASLAIRDARAGRPILVVFTDGADVVSWLPPAAVLDAARRSAAVVYVVDGSGRQCFAEQVMTGGRAGRLPLLGALAHETGGRCWKSDAAGLRDAFLAVSTSRVVSRERAGTS